ncbi:MAG: hypothetical protein VKP63_09380 [Cyanobacteriota bacterium]|nr:hypothetical protein [Cyanobacteriota bacterium]
MALPPLVAGCGPRGTRPPGGPGATSEGRTDPTALRRQAAEARAAGQRARELCVRERPELESRMAALRRAESRLARVKEDSYVPLPPPPAWDEAAESRFRQEDRDADWLRHQQAREAWRLREEERSARWWRAHQARLGDAQAELNTEARALRERRADLFTGPESIEFDPLVAERIRNCRDLAGRPVGKTAHP